MQSTRQAVALNSLCRTSSKLSVAAAVAMVLAQAAVAGGAEFPESRAEHPAPIRLAQNETAKPVVFNIKSQPMAEALTKLGEQSGLTIIVETQVSKGITANALSGLYTPDEALKKLLEPAGLKAEYLDSKTVAVRLASEKDSHESHTTLAGHESAILRLAQNTQTQNDERSLSTDSQSEWSTGEHNESASPQKGGDRAGIEEIVVTATKRSENIMSVPESITALSASNIADRGLVSAKDYLRTIPAVAYIDQGPGQNIVVIRGSYSDAFASGPTVGRYFGEIPLTGLALGGSADVKLIDMERLEVLRGPQGTLYGSNSLSGTIRNIPAAPQLREFEARLGASFSSTDKFGGNNGGAEGVINIPIVADRLAVRGVFYRFEDSGFIRNVAGDNPSVQASAAFFGASGQAGNQDRVGGSTVTGGRISALWKPIDDLDVTFMYLRQDDAADDRPFAQRGLGEYERADYRFGPVVGAGDALKVDLDIQNLLLDYRLPWGSLLSSTSIVHQDFRRLWQIGTFFRVNGFTPPLPQDSVTRARNFTEELRFTSDFEGPWQFIVGAFYEDTEQPTSQVAYYTGDPTRHPFTSGVGTAIGTPRGPGSIYGADIERATEQVAGFGEISYAVTPQLKVTGGLRHFDYDYTFASAVNSFTTNSALVNHGAPFVKTEGESGNTYKVSVEYAPIDSTLVYAKFSQGFRLGRPKNVAQFQNFCDTNGDGLIDGSQLSAVDPLIHSDTLDSYEIGGKATAFDGRVAVSVSGYHNNWKDIPVLFRPPTCPLTSTTFNVGRVTVDGFELEGSTVVGGFVFDLGAGYVDSQLAETSPIGVEGARMNYAPKWNGHLGAEYGFSLAGREAYVRGDWSYYDKFWNGLGQTGTRFDAYDLLDLNIGMSFDRVDVRLFSSNVLGEDAITSDISWPPNGVFPVRPRTIGLRLDTRF